MPFGTPIQATPGGFLLSLLGLAAMIFGGVCTWELFVAIDIPPSKSHPELIMKLGFGSAIGVSLGLLLIRWAWRLATSSDMKNP